VPLVLGLSGAFLLLVRRIPLPLRLPLRVPRRVRLAWTVIRLGPEVAVWVARPPNHAIAQLPFCNIDLKPAMRPEMCVTLAGSIEPGEQVLGSGPEGAEEFEAGESVHRLRLLLCGLACLAQP